MNVIVTKHANDRIRERMHEYFSAEELQQYIEAIAETLADGYQTHVPLRELPKPQRAKDGSQGEMVVAACWRYGKVVKIATVMFRWKWQMK